MKKQNSITLILGGISVVVATVWYLVIFGGNEIVGATAYLFILFSIFVFFGGLAMVQLLLTRKKKFLLSPAFYVLLLYFIVSLALSLLFMLKPVERRNLLIIIQVLLLAITTISLFMMLAAEHSTPSTDFASMEWNDPMREIINKIRALKDDPENQAFKPLLSRLYERSVFIDTSQKLSQDEGLIKGVKDLEIALISRDFSLGDKEAKVSELVEELEGNLKSREYEIRKSPWTKM